MSLISLGKKLNNCYIYYCSKKVLISSLVLRLLHLVYDCVVQWVLVLLEPVGQVVRDGA